MNVDSGYSIKDLEKLSGIKAHTLRIWEKRYSLFNPNRTDTNIRYYSNDDLKRILNISLLNKNGYKISVIAGMKDSEMAEKIKAINLVKTENDDLVENLMVAMIDMNTAVFEKTFTGCILRMGFEDTIQKIIFPFLERIGVMWQTGTINPAQEHFVSNMIRQKMIVAIDGVTAPDESRSGRIAVLFLPEHELHELSLLFYHYALKARGFKTFYLGQAVPLQSLERIVEIVKPDFLVGVMTNSLSAKELKKLMDSLEPLCETTRVLVSGNAAGNIKNQGARHLEHFKNLEELLLLVNK